jgi:O-antigen/teichoic acid export membrane protein
MASPEQRRVLHFGWNAARYALGPIGGSVVPWLVVVESSVETWGQVVTTMILVQLAAHITQWGSKEYLMRQFATSPAGTLDQWRASMITRAVPWLICALILTRSGLIVQDTWAMTWLIGLVLANNMEPLVIWRKKFMGAALADLLGLAVQAGVIIWSEHIDGGTVVRSFAMNQTIRAALLWSILGFPSFGHAFRLFNAPEHLVAALPFFLISLSGLLGSRMDLYTMNAITDRTTVGTYQVVAGLFVQFQALAGLIAVPFTRELYRLRGEGVQRAGGRLARLGLLLLVPFITIAWAVFTFLFRFDLPWSTYLCGALIIWPAYGYVPRLPLLYKHGGEGRMMWANFSAAGLGLLLTWTLVPTIGINGALLAAGAGQLLVLFVVLISIRRVQAAMP